MSNSDIYQVKKVEQPHDIETSVPGSKSITNRALLIAALAEGTSVLHGVLFSDDSRHFMQALYDLGFPIHIDEEEETVNRYLPFDNPKNAVKKRAAVPALPT